MIRKVDMKEMLKFAIFSFVIMVFSSCSTADRIQKHFDNSNGLYGWWGRVSEVEINPQTNDVSMKISVDPEYLVLLSMVNREEAIDAVNLMFLASTYMDLHFLLAVRLIAKNDGNITVTYQSDKNSCTHVSTIQNHYLRTKFWKELTPEEVDNIALLVETGLANLQCPMFLDAATTLSSMCYENNSVVYKYRVYDKIKNGGLSSFWGFQYDIDFNISSIEQRVRGQMHTLYNCNQSFQNMTNALLRVNGSLRYVYVLESSGAVESFSITSEDLKRLIL